jgi:hypothetical protein
MPQLTRENVDQAFRYSPPDAVRAVKHEAVNDHTIKLAKIYFDNCPASPELTLAVRKLQEARMWANAALATNPEADPA